MKRAPQTGSVLVEAAFTLLTLFIFLFGIMEAGRFFKVQQFLTDAAREGARVAATPLTQTTTLATKAQIDLAVQPFLAAAAITNGTVTVNCVSLSNYNTVYDTNPCSAGCPVAGVACGSQVVVSAPYQIMSLAMFSNLSITLKGKALMRNETSP